MVHGVPRLIAFLSEHITLHPGDAIATGTTSRVGYVRRPRAEMTGDGIYSPRHGEGLHHVGA